MEDDDHLPDIYIPEVPNAVLIGFYTKRDTILLSIAGYDAGYIYEYTNPDLNKDTVHVGSYKIVDCNDDEIRNFLF